MKIYFDLTQIMLAHENNVSKYKDRSDWDISQSLVPFYETTKNQSFEVIPPEDIFIVRGDLDILNLNDFDKGGKALGKLLEEVPLFRMRVEIYFDRLLERRHDDNIIEQAVTAGFDEKPIPQTVPIPKEEKNYDLGGKLHHPMIGHLSSEEIATLYTQTIVELRMLDAERAERYSIKEVLGSHWHRLLDFYDGYLHGAYGYARIDKLVSHAHRVGAETLLPHENYIAQGIEAANAIKIDGRRSALQNYAQCDAFQIRRCKQLDKFLSQMKLKEAPEWVSLDIEQLLEKEAMKQVFAQKYQEFDKSFKKLEELENLKAALTLNAEGSLDDLLQTLLSQVITVEGTYNDAARRFVQKGDIRQKEILLALS